MKGRLLGKRSPGRLHIGMLDKLMENDLYAAMKVQKIDRSGVLTPRICLSDYQWVGICPRVLERLTLLYSYITLL